LKKMQRKEVIAMKLRVVGRTVIVLPITDSEETNTETLKKTLNMYLQSSCW